jgi:hypothetical protein
MKRRIASLIFICCGWALPGGAATYNYLLQVAAYNPPGAPGFAAWSVSWQSHTLLNPTSPCPAGIDLSMQPNFTVSGTPQAGYTPFTTADLWSFCSSGGVPVMYVYWADGVNQIIYGLDYSFVTPPFTTGVFSPSDTLVLGTTSLQFPPVPGPPATLTVSKALSFPPLPSWIGSIIQASLTLAGPVAPPAGGPVEAIVGFVDLNGNVLGQATPVQLIPGQVSSVQLNSNTFIHTIGQHTTVIPVVSAPPGTSLPAVQFTGEVYDVLTGFGGVLTAANGLFPPPAALGPQGLAAGQIMRLVATAYPPDPCVATLSFANSEGVAIGPSMQVNLSPGQSQSLELTSASLNLSFGKRVLVQPLVTLQPVIAAAAVVAPACTVASDVFDPIAGRTWTYQTASVK